MTSSVPRAVTGPGAAWQTLNVDRVRAVVSTAHGGCSAAACAVEHVSGSSSNRHHQVSRSNKLSQMTAKCYRGPPATYDCKCSASSHSD